MATEIRVPTLGESVSEATIGKWFKKAGDSVAADEPLVELETDKVTVEVPAPSAGTLAEIAVKEGETVEVGALLGTIGEGGGTATKDDAKGEEKKDAVAQASKDGGAATSKEAAEKSAAVAGGNLGEEVDMPAAPLGGQADGRGRSADQVSAPASGQVLGRRSTLWSGRRRRPRRRRFRVRRPCGRRGARGAVK